MLFDTIPRGSLAATLTVANMVNWMNLRPVITPDMPHAVAVVSHQPRPANRASRANQVQQSGGLALFGVNLSLKIWSTKLSLTIQFFFAFVLILTVLALRGLLSIVINAFSLGNKDPGKNRWYLFVAFAFYIGIIIAAFVTNFSGLRGYVISSDIAQWGQMGDFFGGMLNPILAFASFIALLFTIKLQSEEMKDTRKELMQSRIAQELAANAASDNLRQQKDLAEFEGFKNLIIGQLDDLSVVFNSNKGVYTISSIQEIVLNCRVVGGRKISWLQLKQDVNLKLGSAVSSTHVVNFWSEVAIAKRLAQSMHAPASRLKMVGGDSLYRHYVTKVAFYCCMASLTEIGPEIALKTDNSVLAEEIAKYWQMMNVDPVDTPKN